MLASPATLDKLSFGRIRQALADRAQTRFGAQLAQELVPGADAATAETAHERIDEILTGGDLSLGGIEDITPLVARLREGGLAEGPELLSIAYTLDSAASLKRAIVASERPELGALAERMGSFDLVLRLVREQLDPDGRVRDDATPKLREIRRRLAPLRNRIRERLSQLLAHYAEFVQEPIITLRRERYVIPVKAASQSRVPGIVVDTSDSGATAFVEPQSVIPLNNELALLEFEERDEVRRILRDLGTRLANAPGLDDTLEMVARLDLAQASAFLAREWQLSRPTFHEEPRLRLLRARHPLIDGCVPNDIELNGELRTLLVTGPNAGGKTVLIKTVGLAALMAYAGLFVAAAAERPALLPRLRRVLVDIGDEQSIEASLSTYAGHLTNLKGIVDEADEDVLVLIDELGSGTDPDEGAALSQAILERVLAAGALAMVTTHLAPLKIFAGEAEGVQNGAMRFDVERLRPTYRLVVGEPGRSYALAIARRLGLDDALLERAESLMGGEGRRLESLLEQLEAQREALQDELKGARAEQARAVREAELLREQITRLREKEGELMAAAAERADEMLAETLQRAKELKRTATSDPGARSQALEEIHQLRQQARRGSASGPAKPRADALQAGVLVRVESYGAEGPVLELRGDQVLVQLGLLRVEVPRRDVKVVRREEPVKARRDAPVVTGPTAVDPELNIRGERVEQGLERVLELIGEAHALKMEKVRILHGKGTGALRDAVRNLLKDDRRVERFEDAVPYEGGHGVTVAWLRQR